MKIIQKMADKARDPYHREGVTVAFLGDSVTQGCFDIYKNERGGIETYYDKKSAYETRVFDIFCTLFPSVPVNIINAGISGDSAPHGLERLSRDVLRHEPDLCVVCYGLNDCGTAANSIERYVSALRGILQGLAEHGIETIFMTPNMMNTKVSPHLTDPDFIRLAGETAKKQNDGLFDAHIEAARALCHEMHVPLCDCYAIWRRLAEAGVDTTELLANKINHPVPEMNRLFAYELVKTMFACE